MSGLDPSAFKPLKLAKIDDYNYNSKIFRFELGSESKLNLPVSSFVLTKALIDGKDLMRPYTPIHQDKPGLLNLLIKVYPQGNMSKHIFNLKVGDHLEIKGPMPKLKYTANMKKHIGMLAGGTGITPMLQVVNEIVNNPEDKTQVTLVFANVEERDILLRHEIDHIAAKHKHIKVHYVLEKPPAAWAGSSGFVNIDMIKQFLPQPSDHTLIYVCGPPGFMQALSGTKAPDFSQGELVGALAAAGYTKEQVFKF